MGGTDFSRRFKKSVIDREVSLISVLNQIGLYGYEVNRTCYCPFHENVHTKSAKIYSDDRGETLYCFAENKMYRSSDAVEQLTSINIDRLFSKVWNNLSDEQKLFYQESNGSVEVVSSEWKKVFNEISGFKFGRMTYEEVMKRIKNMLEEKDG